MDNDWLNRLSTNDKVITHHNGYYKIKQVERLTKTQIILNGGDRFRKSNGYKIGEGQWSFTTLIKPTPEKIAEIKEINRRKKLIYDISRTNWTKIKTENLEKVFELTEKDTNK